MVHEKTNEKEALELKKIYNPYLDKRRKIMNSTKFRVEDIFGDVISKDPISPEQTNKLKNFLAKKL